MERRNFLKGALAIFGVAAAGVAVSTGAAEAAPRSTGPALPQVPEPAAAAEEATDAQGQYYIVRRRYRPRRRVVYYRRPVYRRRVYYRRPVYIRRVWW